MHHMFENVVKLTVNVFQCFKVMISHFGAFIKCQFLVKVTLFLDQETPQG